MRTAAGSSARSEASIALTPTLVELERRALRGWSLNSAEPLLLRGERGTGKEVFARHLHRTGPASRLPFFRIACRQQPESPASAQLAEKLDQLAAAGGGTLLLEEVSEAGPGLQKELAELLRRRARPRSPHSSLPRLVAATQVDLEREVEAGRLREDVWLWLRAIELSLPPLRERPDEIPIYLDFFLDHFALLHGKPRPVPDGALREALLRHEWPGNVRELRQWARKLVLLGDPVGALRELVGQRMTGGGRPPAGGGRPGSPSVPRLDLKEIARRAAYRAEREAVLEALTACHWNRRRAARALGVSYKTLLTKIRELGLREG